MLRLGTVPYLNALPLVQGLSADPQVELVEDVPARLAPRLRAGELDLALVSSVELFRLPTLGWVPGPAITSEGPVRSILLFLRTAPARVATLGLDTSSLSAAVMARVCLADLLGVERPALVPAPPELPLRAVDADAILRIGDPALGTDPEGLERLDLGELWTARTGLPFVYALWLGRPDTGLGRHAPRLLRARDEGLPRRAELARRFAAARGSDPEACEEYLLHAIGFDLGPAELAGLLHFGQRAHALGLVDRPDLPAPLAADTVRPARATRTEGSRPAD